MLKTIGQQASRPFHLAQVCDAMYAKAWGKGPLYTSEAKLKGKKNSKFPWGKLKQWRNPPPILQDPGLGSNPFPILVDDLELGRPQEENSPAFRGHLALSCEHRPV
jgi:hypothetical protein